MKIALFVDSLPSSGKKVGGVAVAVARLARELSKKQEVTVVCLNAEEFENLSFKTFNPIKNKFLNKLCRSRIGIVTLYPFLLNFIKLPKVDVAHFHGDDWFLINRPWKVCRTMHGSSIRELKHTQSVLRKIFLAYTYVCEHISARFADRLLCIGSDTQQIYSGVQNYYVANGFEESVFYTKEKEEHSLFFNGWWKGRKRGQFMFAQFVNEILPVFPNAKLYFLADYCPDHENVIHLKGLSDEELAEIYAKCELFTYPSAYEGFGISYLEAMASGAVVVTTKNTGAADVLDHGEYGVICNDDEFPLKIIELLKSEEKRETLRLKAYERAEEYKMEKIAANHMLHYEAVLSGLEISEETK